MLIRPSFRMCRSPKIVLLKTLNIQKRILRPQCLCDVKCLQNRRLLSTSTAFEQARNARTENELLFSSGEDKGRKLKENKNSASAEQLLEKLISNLSTDIHQKNRVYRNDLERVLNRVKELNFSSRRQGLLLLHCCADLMPDESSSSRMALALQVWEVLKPHTKFHVEHYNELLRVYIANGRTLTVSTFLKQMAPVTPNITTYELILRALAEAGDINQATEVISNMKSNNLPATEHVFNALITCQGKAGNLENLQEVLTMMTSLKIDQTVDTYTAIVRAMAHNKNASKVLNAMETAASKVQFTELHIMEIVKTLASVKMYELIPKVLKYLPAETLSMPSISPLMQSVSTSLVFQNHALAALEIFKCLPLPSFGPSDDLGLHGRSLVRDCVKASVPSTIINLITEELMSSGRNPIALHNAAEAALQQGKTPLALDMFNTMRQLGAQLRPHYFWPILLHTSKSYGEKGIMNTLSTMVKMEVKPDHETIIDYTLPYVSFTSPQNLMKKFQETGLSVTDVLTPMMETLLNTGQVRAASEICELFKGKVNADRILKPLLKGYLTSGDLKSTIHVLEDVKTKAADKSKDWVGRFLCTFMQHKKVQHDLSDILALIKSLKPTELRISTAASDYCASRLNDRFNEDAKKDFTTALTDITDEAIVDEGDLFLQQIPHPKQMNEESLQAHLVELEAKGMNTRGVLRKLLQTYLKQDNLDAAKTVVEKLQNDGAVLSAGMKASIFDLHVKLGELDSAEVALSDLTKTYPNFTLDEFKIIDFATLMVYRNNFDRAVQLIKDQSKKRNVKGGRNISMNCWRLLEATASLGQAESVQQMFHLLTSLRYCQPTNTMLGPLIRVHLKNDNLEAAVNEFMNLSNKYKKTPLKHELLCQVLLKMSDNQSEEVFVTNAKNDSNLNKMAQMILNIDRKIHGVNDVQLSLISALAEVGYTKTLRKLLLDPSVKFHPEAMLRRCERFADENKVPPLLHIAAAVKGRRLMDVDDIYLLVLDVFQRADNVTEALSLFSKMQGDEVTPSQKFVVNLCSLLKANNKEIPAELAMLVHKQAKKVNN